MEFKLEKIIGDNNLDLSHKQKQIATTILADINIAVYKQEVLHLQQLTDLQSQLDQIRKNKNYWEESAESWRMSLQKAEKQIQILEKYLVASKSVQRWLTSTMTYWKRLAEKFSKPKGRQVP